MQLKIHFVPCISLSIYNTWDFNYYKRDPSSLQTNQPIRSKTTTTSYIDPNVESEISLSQTDTPKPSDIQYKE